MILGPWRSQLPARMCARLALHGRLVVRDLDPERDIFRTFEPPKQEHIEDLKDVRKVQGICYQEDPMGSKVLQDVISAVE
jgi:hypothetical protein